MSSLSSKNTAYRNDIDGLKALAIIAVVLYHMGFATYGYLGVDLFLVVSGYLFMSSLMKREAGQFSCFRELCSRLLRLYPLILIACSVCFIAGFFTMLPDDYENLSQSVVATNFSANNILAYVTTGNYWEVINELKPLMHTWYLGILVQFYIVFLLLYRIIVKAVKAEKRTAAVLISLTATTVLSLGVYLLPIFNSNMKFYMLPFRFFELSLGCLAAYIHEKTMKKFGGRGGYLQAALPVLAGALFLPFEFIPGTVRLLLVVGCAVCAVLCTNHSKLYSLITSNNIVTAVGKASFSIYVWHQILLAFTRYTVTTEFTVFSAAIFFAVVAVVSVFSYLLVEKRLGSVIKKRFAGSIVIILLSTALISSAAGVVYLRAGVVRDVPELDISTENVTRGMHAQYNHKIWQLEKIPFEDNGRINVLIVGNSYARDWANILLESEMGNLVNISYAFSWDEELVPLIREASYVFSQSLMKEEVPDYVWSNTNTENVYGLGTKRFGENNGIIYSQRYQPSYLQMTVEVPDTILKTNDELSNSWGVNYINLIELVQYPDGTVPVFTSAGKFISQDCWHLTKAGAIMYARLVDWNAIFDEYNIG